MACPMGKGTKCSRFKALLGDLEAEHVRLEQRLDKLTAQLLSASHSASLDGQDGGKLNGRGASPRIPVCSERLPSDVSLPSAGNAVGFCQNGDCPQAELRKVAVQRPNDDSLEFWIAQQRTPSQSENGHIMPHLVQFPSDNSGTKSFGVLASPSPSGKMARFEDCTVEESLPANLPMRADASKESLPSELDQREYVSKARSTRSRVSVSKLGEASDMSSRSKNAPRAPQLHEVFEELKEMDSADAWKAICFVGTHQATYKRMMDRARTGEMLIEESRFNCMVMRPGCFRRLVWDILSCLVVLYDLTVIPLEAFSPELNLVTMTLDLMTTTFWTCDVPVSCLTGYHTEGVVEMRVKKIVKRYMRTWMTLDVCTLCADWAMVAFTTGAAVETIGVLRVGKSMRLFRILRVMQISRLGKLHKSLTELFDKIQSEYTRTFVSVGLLLLGIAMINHYSACAWYGIAKTNVSNAAVTWITEHETLDNSMLYWYLTSLHWSLTQFTPAGMEVHAYNTLERSYSVFVLLFALITFSSFVSSLTGAMQYIQQLKAQTIAHENLLRRYFLENKISAELGHCIWLYLSKHHFGKRKRFHEKDIDVFKYLPQHLLSKMHEELYTPIITQVPFFETYAVGCSSGLAELCHRACSPRSFSVGEAVFMDGENGEYMYFVKAGSLSYTPSLETHRKVTLQEGSWACEPCLWLQWTHCGRLMSSFESEIIALHADTFRTVVTSDYHIGMREYVKIYISYFAEFMQRSEDAWRDDLCADRAPLSLMVHQAKQDVLTLVEEMQTTTDVSTFAHSNGLWSGTASHGIAERSRAGIMGLRRFLGLKTFATRTLSGFDAGTQRSGSIQATSSQWSAMGNGSSIQEQSSRVSTRSTGQTIRTDRSIHTEQLGQVQEDQEAHVNAETPSPAIAHASAGSWSPPPSNQG